MKKHLFGDLVVYELDNNNESRNYWVGLKEELSNQNKWSGSLASRIPSELTEHRLFISSTEESIFLIDSSFQLEGLLSIEHKGDQLVKSAVSLGARWLGSECGSHTDSLYKGNGFVGFTTTPPIPDSSMEYLRHKSQLMVFLEKPADLKIFETRDLNEYFRIRTTVLKFFKNHYSEDFAKFWKNWLYQYKNSH